MCYKVDEDCWSSWNSSIFFRHFRPIPFFFHTHTLSVFQIHSTPPPPPTHPPTHACTHPHPHTSILTIQSLIYTNGRQMETWDGKIWQVYSFPSRHPPRFLAVFVLFWPVKFPVKQVTLVFAKKQWCSLSCWPPVECNQAPKHGSVPQQWIRHACEFNEFFFSPLQNAHCWAKLIIDCFLLGCCGGPCRVWRYISDFLSIKQFWMGFIVRWPYAVDWMVKSQELTN